MLALQFDDNSNHTIPLSSEQSDTPTKTHQKKSRIKIKQRHITTVTRPSFSKCTQQNKNPSFRSHWSNNKSIARSCLLLFRSNFFEVNLFRSNRVCVADEQPETTPCLHRSRIVQTPSADKRGGPSGGAWWCAWVERGRVGRTLQSRERERHRPPRPLPALFP